MFKIIIATTLLVTGLYTASVVTLMNRGIENIQQQQKQIDELYQLQKGL